MIDGETVNTYIDDEFERRRREENMAGDREGNVWMHGDRFNIMGADYFMADILHMLQDIYGRGAGGILRQTGKQYGADLIDQVGHNTDPDITFGQFLGLLAFLGYSLPRIEDDTVTVPSSPTAEEYRKSEEYTPTTTCYFLAGMISGAAAKCYDTDEDITFVETACIADGDEACVFERE